MELHKPSNTEAELQRPGGRHRRPLIRPPLKPRNVGFFLLSLLAAAGLVLYLLQHTPLPREAAYMAGTFVLAGLLWVTEALCASSGAARSWSCSA